MLNSLTFIATHQSPILIELYAVCVHNLATFSRLGKFMCTITDKLNHLQLFIYWKKKIRNGKPGSPKFYFSHSKNIFRSHLEQGEGRRVTTEGRKQLVPWAHLCKPRKEGSETSRSHIPL